MSEPIPFRVTRYRCPHCPRTGSGKARVAEHMARCWRNPAVRGCKTCRHFVTWMGDYGSDCAVGVSLAGRPECTLCHGFGRTFGDDLGVSECTECGGDGAEIKPGPIVGCEKWEAADGAEA